MKVTIEKNENLYQGFCKLNKITFTHELFKGGQSPVISREVLVRQEAVCVLPYDPKLDKIILVEQIRIPTLNKRESPWMLELVAGLIDSGEDIETCAKRESVEEANLTITDLHYICNYFPSPGLADEKVHLFIGKCDLNNAGGIYGKDDEGEDIKAHVFTFAQALELMQAGKLDNAACLISLMYLQANKGKVF
jgi:ADP-ribose pyrophosphatase